MSFNLSEIWIYPIKSARGLLVNQAEITSMGFKWDRRWMLIDRAGRFISQRECPMLARLTVQFSDKSLLVQFDSDLLQIPLPPDQSLITNEIEVLVWRNLVKAHCYNDTVSQWFSEHMKLACQLVYMPETTFRPTNPEYAAGKRVSFADGYPFLLCNQASLNELNYRLMRKDLEPVGIERFRPNLVVSTNKPYVEDLWNEIQIGPHIFQIVKPCERCVVIATDQFTGKVGKEPLNTLSGYRKINGKVIFGQNLVCQSENGQLFTNQLCVARF